MMSDSCSSDESFIQQQAECRPWARGHARGFWVLRAEMGEPAGPRAKKPGCYTEGAGRAAHRDGGGLDRIDLVKVAVKCDIKGHDRLLLGLQDCLHAGGVSEDGVGSVRAGRDVGE